MLQKKNCNLYIEENNFFLKNIKNIKRKASKAG